MENQMRKGMRRGALLALLIIFMQPFQPMKGLIPELSNFLTSIPLWTAAVIFHPSPTPLMQGLVVLAYFIVVGGLIGLAFERRALWGWLLILVLCIHHYNVYEELSQPMGEVVQTTLNYFFK